MLNTLSTAHRKLTKRQENEADQPSSELPILGEEDKSQESSDQVTFPSPSQQEAGTRHTLATEPFQPILKVLADLESDDPNRACPNIDGQKLEQDSFVLKEAGAHLRKKRDGFQARHDKQLSRLRFFEQALELSRERLASVLDDWNYPSRLSLAEFLDNARGD
ncbi:hypothetical protein MYU51_000733 [Penicillium brevicompactum]